MSGRGARTSVRLKKKSKVESEGEEQKLDHSKARYLCLAPGSILANGICKCNPFTITQEFQLESFPNPDCSILHLSLQHNMDANVALDLFRSTNFEKDLGNGYYGEEGKMAFTLDQNIKFSTDFLTLTVGALTEERSSKTVERLNKG